MIFHGHKRDVDVIRWIDYVMEIIESGQYIIMPGSGSGSSINGPGGGTGASDPSEWNLDLDELEELGIDVQEFRLDDPSSEDVEIPEIDTDEMKWSKEEKDVKVKVDPSDRFFTEVKRNIAWSRLFARDVSRIVEDGRRPRVRGTFESGVAINPSQLYRLKTEVQPRIHKRRSKPRPEPVEFILLVDESSSIRSLPIPLFNLYKDFKWMLAEGLALAKQDFAMLGYNDSVFTYKSLGEPYTNYIRMRMKPSHAHSVGRARGFATYTALAIRTVRDMNRSHARVDARRRVCLCMTDGDPTGGPESVAKEVRAAHDEGLRVVGIILPRYFADEDFIQRMSGQYDHMVILDPKDRVGSEHQLRQILIRELKSLR